MEKTEALPKRVNRVFHLLYFLLSVFPLLVSAEMNQKTCPDSPNCVSSYSDSQIHSIAPLMFEGDVAETQKVLKDAVMSLPRMALVESREGYMHFVQTSLIFRFKDDLELWLDRDEKVFHVRSASRVGRSDLGVNRKRVEKIRSTFASMMKP